MWIQFILENIHFALNLLAALVFFAVFWLYFDAWVGRKTLKDGFKIAGFLLLAISFTIHAVFLESTILTTSILGKTTHFWLLTATRIPGYLFLILGLILDPLQPHPKKESVKKETAFFPVLGSTLIVTRLIQMVFPILAASVGFLFLRRSTIGLENHLKVVALSFFILSIFELLAMSAGLQDTSSVDLYDLVAPFGPVWIVEHVILLVAITTLGLWVKSYLTKRFQSQLFMILNTSILIIFLLTTVSFSGLLLKNLENEAYGQLETNVKVLNFAIDSKKAETLSDAQVLSQDTKVQTLLGEKNRPAISDLLQSVLLTKKQSTLVIVNETGQVMGRGEDRERVGDSISGDPLIKRALLGESVSSITTKDGVLAPQIFVMGSTPIRKGEEIVGAVLTGTVLDNAFMDGIKKATSLEASIYADNTLSATTLLASDGKSRWIGVKEEKREVKDQVLQKGGNLSVSINLLGRPYFASYLPIKDIDNTTVGMLFVGRPQLTVLQTAGRSIELTFVIAAILMVVSIFPAYFIAKYLTNQIR